VQREKVKLEDDLRFKEMQRIKYVLTLVIYSHGLVSCSVGVVLLLQHHPVNPQ
jgi:hypothetical protein